MRRFNLLLSDEVYHEFLLCFPDHGDRTKLLRRCIYRLIDRAKVKGKAWEADVDRIADKVSDDWRL